MNPPLKYLVTGATGLIGRHLVQRLLRRGLVYVLVRQASLERNAPLLEAWRQAAGAEGCGLEVLTGEITSEGLGVDDAEALPDFDHVIHLAALYDLTAAEDALLATNVEGTRRLLQFLQGRGFGGVLHHVSSVAVAGDHDGLFAEDLLDQGQAFPHPYHRSKLEAERLVREQAGLRFRIYRPSAVVGHSKTGEMDRVDGPYYMFKSILRMRNALPPWFPLPGLSSKSMGPVNMVPVDYVADAMDALAHADGLDGKTFHVVDAEPPSFLETFNLVAEAAGAPGMSSRFGTGLLKYMPGVGDMVGRLGGVQFYRQQMRRDLGIPDQVHEVLNHKVRYDTANIADALRGTKIRCPRQAEYIPAMWDYWLRHLDIDRDPAVRRRTYFEGKTVLISGASSGVGEALAVRCAEAGAHVLLVARREEELCGVADRCRRWDDRVAWYVADLSDMEACDRLVQRVLDEQGHVDILVNNAARSIRRPLAESLERFHDFERVMRLNFFGSIRLIRGFLPGMRERRSGHIVNVLTAGAVLPTPLFGAYGASKAALHHVTDTLAAEFLAEDIHCTGVYLPFVRTPMMSTEVYDDSTKAMTAEKAALWLMDGVAQRRRHVMNSDTTRRAVINNLAPAFMTRVINVLYRIYGEDEDRHPELAMDRMLLKRFIKGRLM